MTTKSKATVEEAWAEHDRLWEEGKRLWREAETIITQTAMALYGPDAYVDWMTRTVSSGTKAVK